jgi:hypothetical protein
MSESTHVYLVSAQATPNITPATDPRVAPRRVVLVVSPDMRQRAQWLSDVLRKRGIRVDQWPIEDAWDVEHVQMRVLELLDEERDLVEARDVALNATGGTKPMSIAAYDAFRAYELPIFYVHPERDRVIWLSPSERPAVDLENRLTLEPFLAAHGARVTALVARDPVSARDIETARDLVKEISRYSKPLRVLNLLANGAERKLRSEPMDQRQAADPNLAELIDRFHAARYLSRDGNCLVFPGEDERFFVNGGWLELYVFERLQHIRGERRVIQDLGRNVSVERDTRSGNVPNELDVAVLAENRLYVLECKTRGWRGGVNGPGAESLFKLEALTDLFGGLQARGMLVSYQELPDHDRRRAADLRIEVCAGRNLQRLDEFLKRWIQ